MHSHLKPFFDSEWFTVWNNSYIPIPSIHTQTHTHTICIWNIVCAVHFELFYSVSLSKCRLQHTKLILWSINELFIWTTALSNSVKLWAMPCRATQNKQVMVENFDETWSTGEGNGKLLQYSCLENPMNNMKRKKDTTLKDELPRLVGIQYTTGEEWRNHRLGGHEAEQALGVGDGQEAWYAESMGWKESDTTEQLN